MQIPNNRSGYGRRLIAVLMGALMVVTAAACADKTSASQGTVDSSGDSSSIAETQPVTVVGEALPPTGDFANDAAIGMDAPTLEGFDFAGNKVVYDFSDGPTLLMFFAHWCPHCNREMPLILQWKNSGQMPQTLKVLAVSTDVQPTGPNFPPSKWFPGMGWEWPVMADSNAKTAATAFGVTGYPYWVVIGADGKVKLRNSGEVPLNQLGPMITGSMNS